jgi:hypothetical protein
MTEDSHGKQAEGVGDSTAGNDLRDEKPVSAKPRSGETPNLDTAEAIDVDAAHDRSS